MYASGVALIIAAGLTAVIGLQQYRESKKHSGTDAAQQEAEHMPLK